MPALYRLGLLEVDAKEDKKAAKLFIKIVKIDPEHMRAKAQLGMALGRLKKDKRAKKILEKVVHADPKYIPGRAMLATSSSARATSKAPSRNGPPCKN